MGAHSDFIVIECTRDELQKQFRAEQQQMEYENGHSGYNGTLSTCNGLKIGTLPEDVEITHPIQPFHNHAVCDYILDNTEKREEAMAIEITDGVWLIGGWAAC
jgi:hypothetical protein